MARSRRGPCVRLAERVACAVGSRWSNVLTMAAGPDPTGPACSKPIRSSSQGLYKPGGGPRDSRPLRSRTAPAKPSCAQLNLARPKRLADESRRRRTAEEPDEPA